jgi:hypothetical protein
LGEGEREVHETCEGGQKLENFGNLWCSYKHSIIFKKLKSNAHDDTTDFLSF